ncbi:ornithine cyclodeaminase family protein [Pseudomonas sp. NPDC089547]|uniref:ornithine cyclodeaminase family protein n=1 Tax=Pseudomonas sp. NPDC089547 TaxID=3390652 RepID=UPI003CFF3E38
MKVISAAQINSVLTWDIVIAALEEGHLGARPTTDDIFIGSSEYALFSRGVVLPGTGAGVKIASIFPGNANAIPPLPTEQAAIVFIDDLTKAVSAVFDGPAITAWKTAADSALAAKKLSRVDSDTLLVLGAGPVAKSLTEAYLHVRPSIKKVLLWNRTPSKLREYASELQSRGVDASVANDLDQAVAEAALIVSATGASAPIIKGKLVQPGSHVDLVGGFRPDMREADSDLFAKAKVYVDDRQSALNSGDILTPINEGRVAESCVIGDLYEICQTRLERCSDSDITVYKNSGGAHLDLMVCRKVLSLL